jgi:hypothetical protein
MSNRQQWNGEVIVYRAIVYVVNDDVVSIVLVNDDAKKSDDVVSIVLVNDDAKKSVDVV